MPEKIVRLNIEIIYDNYKKDVASIQSDKFTFEFVNDIIDQIYKEVMKEKNEENIDSN